MRSTTRHAEVLRSELESVAPVVQELRTMRGLAALGGYLPGLSRHTLRAATSRSATFGWVWGRTGDEEGPMREERLAQAFRMWETACVIVRGAVREQHPEFSELEVLRESARRLSHGATDRVPV